MARRLETGRYNAPTMRSAIRGVYVILAALASVLFACRAAAPAPHPLEALFADLHERGLFDGAVVVSDRHGVFEKGFGYANRERQLLFTPDTPSDGASLAKTFTAALLIVLHEERKLNLDDPAHRLIPELPYPTITLRHLIAHSAGLPVLDYDYFDPYIPRDEVRTTERLVRVLADRKPALAAMPGTSFEYSSLGYDIAALAAARAGGKSYFDLLNERFFRPLGISSAFVRPGHLKDFPGVRTLGYRRVDGQLQLNDVFDLEAFHGGSNIYISARDLDKWNMSFVRAPLLQSAGVSASVQPATIGTGTSGLTLGSWYYSEDRTAFWYSGHLQGFHSEIFRDLKAGFSAVYVSNNTLEPWLQKGIIRAMRTVIAGGTPPRLAAPAVQAVVKADRPALAGRWATARGEAIAIDGSEPTLRLVRSGVRYRIVQLSPMWFYVPGVDYVLGFAQAADGAWSKIYLSTNMEEEWGSRLR
jgi:CubicO group peptidase (beta-lactamase class C family)